MKDEIIKDASLAPRKLGDQWESWSLGHVEENNGDLDTSPWYFLIFSILTTLIFTGVFSFFLYLIEPRLTELHPLVHKIVSIAGYAIVLLVIVSVMLLVMTVVTERPYAFFLKNKEIANSSLVPFTLKLARYLGLSKDRLYNSILKVGNSVTRALYPSVKAEELLIVVPRCLSKFMREELTSLTEKYGTTYYTASGGNAARELLVTKQPKGIIAVACERDLFSGVQDVNAAFPVITVANKRPEGPCRNTHIDLSEMEDAIRFFLGIRDKKYSFLIEKV